MTQGVSAEMGANAVTLEGALAFMSGTPTGEVTDQSLFAELLALLQATPAVDTGTPSLSDQNPVPPPVPEDRSIEGDDLPQVVAMLGLPVAFMSVPVMAVDTPAQGEVALQVRNPFPAAPPGAHVDQVPTSLVPEQAGVDEENVLAQQPPVRDGVTSREGFVLPPEVMRETPNPTPDVSVPPEIPRGQVFPTVEAREPSPATAVEASVSANPTPAPAPPGETAPARPAVEEATAQIKGVNVPSASAQRTDISGSHADMGTQREHGESASRDSAPSAAKGARRFVIADGEAILRTEQAGGQAVSVHDASALHRPTAPVDQPVHEVSPAEVVRQVVQEIETMAHQQRTSSVSLQLEPEHLGKLRVTISVRDGVIHTHIVADNHAVRQMLESNSALLQQALQERGMQLGALQVSVQGDGRHFSLHQPYRPPQPVASAETTREVIVMHATTAGGINLLV